AAAIRLAQAGLAIALFEGNRQLGGSARTTELTLPGFHHDVCSAVHPLGMGSPFFRSLPLEKYGLRWIQPPLPLAHPIDDGTPAVLARSMDETAEMLGTDGKAWRGLFGPLVSSWEKLAQEFLQPLLHWPRHPYLLARF